MNTPIEELSYLIPREVINNIQKYTVNNVAIHALNNYFDYLYVKKELYEDFVWNNYVYPNCKCNNCPDNGMYKIYKRKDCDACFMFDSTHIYTPIDFMECIIDNPQYYKIINQK